MLPGLFGTSLEEAAPRSISSNVTKDPPGSIVHSPENKLTVRFSPGERMALIPPLLHTNTSKYGRLIVTEHPAVMTKDAGAHPICFLRNRMTVRALANRRIRLRKASGSTVRSCMTFPLIFTDLPSAHEEISKQQATSTAAGYARAHEAKKGAEIRDFLNFE